MSQSSDHDSSQVHSLQEVAAILASRQVDQDLTEPEIVSLTAAKLQFPEISVFQKNSAGLGALMKGIPVQKISGLVFEAFSLEQSPSRSIVLGASNQPLPVPSRRKFAGLVSILVLVSCWMLAVLNPLENDSLPRLSSSRMIQKAAQTFVTELTDQDEWNVVVVRMDENDRSDAIQKMQSIVRNHGLSLARSAGDEMPEWLGFILTADAQAQNDVVVDEIERQVSGLELERDPVRIAQSSREELIAAVRESLRYPTQSELNHGKVYLALPDQKKTGAESIVAAASPPLPVPSESDAAGFEGISSRANLAELPAVAPSRAVTLVVFQFSDDTSTTTPQI